MTKEPKGGGLFIVDNSISGWSGLRYLHDWTDLAERFDIATGFFEIGALLELDGKWQHLDKIRILMGAETTLRTKAAIREAVKTLAEHRLDESLETDKDKNPFLAGVPAIVEALRSGQIECRVYNKGKFHAKAYITHARMEVIGAQALVGSSNFTKPGLADNIELNIQVQSGREVAQLQDWYEKHWQEAEDVTEEILTVVERHTRLFTPFDVYARALHEFFKGHEMTAGEWEESKSRLFPQLGRYQKEAYWSLMKIARRHRGAFLCDGVGLGKTFVGLMLIERLILHEGKRVVLFAPKGAKEGVWEPHLRQWLPHIGGVGGGADFSNLAVFSHTDLSRPGEFPERFRRIAQLADVVIIDEAHHFRNPGSRGDEEKGKAPSRYYLLDDLIGSGDRHKTMFLLTATPINNRLADFRHMAELFTRRDDTYFARTLGINNLTAHFNLLEKKLSAQLEDEGVGLAERLVEANEFLSQDDVFRHLVVQRSRGYARESQERENEAGAVFPVRKAPKVAEYSIRKTYGGLLDMIEKAFSKKRPLFSLAMYYPLAYYCGDDESIDPFEEGRQKQVVGLIRTQFLKRFESSVAAFELSCDRLMRKLLAFVTVHSESDPERKRLERWKLQNADVLEFDPQRRFAFWEAEEPEEGADDVVLEEFMQQVEQLSPEEFKVGEMIQETFLDLDEIARFLRETRKFEPKHDDKLKKLIRLLNSKDLAGHKVVIFTEFADTARYLHRQLHEEGINGVAEIDGSSTTDRADVIQRFSPYYNATSSHELAESGRKEIRVLISTDVLSEGLNLQDASRMINYDIHWNPVRLMQRIGRVDRRLNSAIEEQLTSDHPEIAASRGKVWFWNFLPPDELNAILSLYSKVTQKTLLISKTLGIEGRKLLRPEDDYEALKEFNQSYEGTKTATEQMHLEYQQLVHDNPELGVKLANLPGAIFSGRKRLSKGLRGVFLCFGLPALDTETNEFSLEAGTTRWYFHDLANDTILEEPGEIITSIRSKTNTPRRCRMDHQDLIGIRDTVLKHIKNTYLKRVDAPLGVKPVLKCWMELNEE